MSIYVCAVDTNVRFNKDVYYIKFKGKEIRYVPRFKDGKQDDLILKMDSEDSEITAYHLVTELLSALSYSWDAVFDIV